jgi:hypothetical protein
MSPKDIKNISRNNWADNMLDDTDRTKWLMESLTWYRKSGHKVKSV